MVKQYDVCIMSFWQVRKDVEGSLFLIKRSVEPLYQIIILNKKSHRKAFLQVLLGFCLQSWRTRMFKRLSQLHFGMFLQKIMWRTCWQLFNLRSPGHTCCIATRMMRWAAGPSWQRSTYRQLLDHMHVNGEADSLCTMCLCSPCSS